MQNFKWKHWLGLVSLAGLLIAGSAMAQPRYQNYAEMTTALQKLAKQNPQLVQLTALGETLGKRNIWLLTVADGKPQDKPAILLVGGVEGADIAASELCLAYAEHLVANYGKVDSVTQLLKNTTYYILPRVNPDATEGYFAALKYERRLNARAMDLDRDGETDEDGYDDLNGDGVITRMRVADPAGEWMPDEKNPPLLKKADRAKGEQGMYRLYSEGRDNDGDGQFNEDEPGGVNFNRNFTFNYKFFERGAGLHQISEIETRAVADFAFDHENIALVFTFSPNDNLLHPWKAKPAAGKAPASSDGPQRMRRGNRKVTAVLPDDAPIFKHISEQFKEITGLKDAPKPPKANGAFSEWAYYHYGRWSLSVPAWWPPKVQEKADTSAAKKEKKPEKKAPGKRPGKGGKAEASADVRLWKWLQATGQESAFVPWTEIDHPDFPGAKVEVGGFKPHVGINPPPDSLAALAQKVNRFFLHLGSWLPKLEIASVRVESLHKNAYRVTAKILNRGYLPTNSAMGERARWPKKIKATLELGEDQSLASGRKVQLLDPLAGNGGSKELTWVVVGKKGSRVQLTAGSPTCSSVEKSIELK